jgi:hypothetical protein
MPAACITVAVVHATELQQRVVGQLVLGLRGSRLLAGARDIDYDLDEHGVITIDWVEGPYADEVAAGLAAYSAAGLLDVDAIAPDPTGNHLRAEILISGLPVVLRAFEPLGLERAKRATRTKRRAPEWTWPSPLEQEGAAHDTVLWTQDPEKGTVATVVRLPIDTPDGWYENRTLVVVPDQDTPSGVWLERRQLVDRAREKASILLRVAPHDWTVNEADDWMDTELNSKHAIRATTAVVLQDRCVLRRWSGLRMEATLERTRTYRVPWSHVPAALLSSLVRAKRLGNPPPKTLKVRAFGDIYSLATISITSTWSAPSQHYVGFPARGI